jgi:hypothetical protein
MPQTGTMLAIPQQRMNLAEGVYPVAFVVYEGV